MQKEDIIIDMIKDLKELRATDKNEMLDKFISLESRQSADKKEIFDKFTSLELRQSTDKKELLDKISSFEANTNIHFTGIQNTLSYERIRLDENS